MPSINIKTLKHIEHGKKSNMQITDVDRKQRVLSTCGLSQTSTGAMCTARPIQNIVIKMYDCMHAQKANLKHYNQMFPNV